MTNQVRLPARRTFFPSPNLIAWYPIIQQASTDVSPTVDRLEDRSGKGNHGVFGPNAPNVATRWAVANRYTSVDNTSGTLKHGPSLPWSRIQWNKDTETLLIAGLWKGTNVGNRHVLGFGSAAAPTTVHGFALRANGTTGMPLAQFHTTAGTQNPNTGDVALADNTEHAICVVLDGTTKVAWIWQDGVLNPTLNGGVFLPGISFAAFAPNMSNFGDLIFGGVPAASGTNFDQTYASTHAAWQVAKRSGGMPANMDAVARRLARHWWQPLTVSEF